MDFLEAMDIAEAILKIVHLVAEFSFGDYVSAAQNEKERRLMALPALIAHLSAMMTHPQAAQQPLHSLQQSASMLALKELATTSIQEAHKLVEVVSNAGNSFQNSTMSFLGTKETKGNPPNIPMMEEVSYKKTFETIGRKVMLEVQLAVSSQQSELTYAVESLKDDSHHGRPEQESRLDTLSKEVDRLSHIMPNGASTEDVHTNESLSITDIQSIKAQSQLITTINKKVLADKIVASLNYSSRAARQGSVPHAHRDTFQWAFDSRLSDWFLNGNGIFWISGLPGSGKSTFMKFVTNQQQTKALLTSWAGHEENLAVASHFFWIAGTPIQKSWQGLLQSLLFDILNKHPSVISIISPARWAAANAGKWQIASEPWSLTELTASLRALASADSIPIKMCFFIDGLDEYESNHLELCKVLQDMARSPHIKICVSSRPWSVFEQSFGGNPTTMLEIHELTRHDIKRFVGDQLQSHPQWAITTSTNTSIEQKELVDEIAARGNGVFLWAYFATRSLREGLDHHEMVSELRLRLNRLPSALDSLFRQMLESVDSQDQPKMASILQAASHGLEPLHIDLYWYIEKELSEHQFAYRCPIGYMRREFITERRDQTTKSINEKSKGLLKVVNEHVEFVHRTVKDFVLTREMGDYLRHKLPSDFNGFISIATAYLGFLKGSRQDNYIFADMVRLAPGQTSGPFISHLNRALMYIAEAMKSCQDSSRSQTFDLLDHYEKASAQMIQTGHVTIRGLNSQSCDPRLPFREELIRHDVTPYIADKLVKEPGFFDLFDDSPLFAVLTPMSLSSGESPAPVLGNLRLILQRGDDPNGRSRLPNTVNDVSPWAQFARSVMSVFNMLSGPCMFPALRWNDSLNGGIFDILLSYGADPNQPLVHGAGSHTVFSHFLDISLSKFLGAECFEGYLRTLDCLLRANASLGVPVVNPPTSPNEPAVGNLARKCPTESILTAYCEELRGLMPRLSADLERARFVSCVTKKLIIHHKQDEIDLDLLLEATSAGIPSQIAHKLLRLIEEKRSGTNSIRSTKRSRQSGDFGEHNSNAKHLKADTIGL